LVLEKCHLETMPLAYGAQVFYKRTGFVNIDAPLDRPYPVLF
jgi:hypothetical protein